MTFTVVVEFDVNPAHYPDSETDEERIAVDLAGAKDDSLAFISQDADWTITAEVIKAT